MNIVIAEIHLPLRIYADPSMTEEEFLRVHALNDTVSIERELDVGIVIRMLPGERPTVASTLFLRYNGING